MAEELMTMEEVAEYLRIPKTTLYQWRSRRTGPPGLRVGKHVRYRQRRRRRLALGPSSPRAGSMTRRYPTIAGVSLDPATTPTVTVEIAGKAMGVGKNSAYAAAHSGKLPTIQIGRRIVVPTAALVRLLELDQPQPAA